MRSTVMSDRCVLSLGSIEFKEQHSSEAQCELKLSLKQVENVLCKIKTQLRFMVGVSHP